MYAYLIIGATVVIVIGLVYAIGYFKGSKKAGNIDNVVKEIDTLSPLLVPVVGYIENKLPEPYKSKAVSITSLLGDAVTMAETAWKNGQLTTDSRKAFATTAVSWGLAKLNIAPTDAEAKVISSVIDLTVGLFLPPSNVVAEPRAATVNTI
jgi:hypothetical protein